MNRLVDSLLEEIGDQLESLGLDPLPIPDIRIPYSLDTVIVLSFIPFSIYVCIPGNPLQELYWSNYLNLNPGDWPCPSCTWSSGNRYTRHKYTDLSAPYVTNQTTQLCDLTWEIWQYGKTQKIIRNGEIFAASITTDMWRLLKAGWGRTCPHTGCQWSMMKIIMTSTVMIIIITIIIIDIIIRVC